MKIFINDAQIKIMAFFVVKFQILGILRPEAEMGKILAWTGVAGKLMNE